MARIDTMHPACIEVEEVEGHVANIGDGEHEEEARRIRCNGKHGQIEDEVGDHGAIWCAMLVGFAKIFRKPAVNGSLVKRAGRACHSRHDRQHEGQDHENHEDGMNEGTAADHVTCRIRNTGAADNAGLQHPIKAENALEGEGNGNEENDAQNAGIEDGLKGIRLWVDEFAGVANGRFKAISRPSRDIKTAQEQRPAVNVPRAVFSRRQSRRRNEMGEIIPMHFAGQNRQNADRHKRGNNDNADPFLEHRRAGNAPMLDKEDPQHDERADKEG